MNDHQLLCFLTVSRTLNFTTAARELYCTQPALSYQIRSLEKELDLALFERSTTRVALTEAGRAFVPQAEGIYRSVLNARTALKAFAPQRTLTLRLPPVLLQRDPIYPILMARLHAALPGDRLLHAARAGGAAHAGHIVGFFFQLASSFGKRKYPHGVF